MIKYDAEKLFTILKWAERVMMLEEASGKEINEMLGHYADLNIKCDNCPIKEKCNTVEINCNEIWKRFLEGKY